MTPFHAYIALGFAILAEVTGSTFLQMSNGFTRLAPAAATAVLYILSFWLLGQALRVIPLGVAYAIWAGLGIVLTAITGVVLFRFTLDAAALLGISLIVAGVVVLNVFSNSTTH